MKLALTFPPTWDLVEGPSQRMALLRGAGGKPDAIVTYGPIVIAPDEPGRWQEQTAHGDLPRDAHVVIGRTVDVATRDGWKLRLVEAEVRNANHEVLEIRLCGFYSFFEHAAAVVVRTQTRADMQSHGSALVAILQGGRPDWSGDPVCLDDVWDLGSPRRVLAPRAATSTASEHVQRGVELLERKRADEALAALSTALELAPNDEPALYFTGVAYGDLGQHADAIRAWEQAAAVSPDRIETLYNLAQARVFVKDFAGALAGFQRVIELDPQDVMTLRKIAQCQYALGRDAEGQATRTELRRRWAASTRPGDRFVTEYVFDQFTGDGFGVHAIETLRPSDPDRHAVLTFRAVELTGTADQPLAAAVVVETGTETPYVIGVHAGNSVRTVRTLTVIPPYPELKREVLALLGDAMGPRG